MADRTFLPIVGESHYQAELRAALAAHPDRVLPAFLEREPDNPFDKNAIAINGAEGQTFGYLNREMAKEFDRALESVGGRLGVHAELRGGEGDHEAIGIVFDGAALIDHKHQAGHARRARPQPNVTADEIRDIVKRGLGVPPATLSRLTEAEMPEFCTRGKALEDEGLIVEALNVYEEALARGADTPFTFARLGVLYRRYHCGEAQDRVRDLSLARLGFDASAPEGQRRGVDTSRDGTTVRVSPSAPALDRAATPFSTLSAVSPSRPPLPLLRKAAPAPALRSVGAPSSRARLQAAVIVAVLIALFALLVYLR